MEYWSIFGIAFYGFTEVDALLEPLLVRIGTVGGLFLFEVWSEVFYREFDLDLFEVWSEVFYLGFDLDFCC